MSQNIFQKILVPLDGSANSMRGLNAAILLAKQSGGYITGLYVISSSGFSKASSMLKKYKKELKSNSETIMFQAKTNAAKNGIKFEGKVIVSPGIVRTIVGFAKSKKYDVIVMGSRGQSSPDVKYLGSVANGVLYDLNMPILIVK